MRQNNFIVGHKYRVVCEGYGITLKGSVGTYVSKVEYHEQYSRLHFSKKENGSRLNSWRNGEFEVRDEDLIPYTPNTFFNL